MIQYMNGKKRKNFKYKRYKKRRLNFYHKNTNKLNVTKFHIYRII